MKTKTKIRTIVVFSAIFVLAVAAFYAVYLTDNKYTAPGPQPTGGILRLDEDSLAAHPVFFLVQDWEIYRDKLLTPDDFIDNPPSSDEFVFIGQYDGFEKHIGSESVSGAHSSTTYRLNIFLPETPGSYILELPEVHSSYKLYINGVLMKQMGNSESWSYRSHTAVSSVMLQASGHMEILIAVMGHDHFYSGMFYPPAFGETEAVITHQGIRSILRIGSCALSLCFAFPSLLIGLLIRRKGQKNDISAMAFLYSGICLAFTIYNCYPILKSITSTGLWFYAMRNFAWCIMPLLTMLIQKKISGLLAKWTNIFIMFGVFVCLWAVMVPVFLHNSLGLMNIYTVLIDLYIWASALYLTLCAVLSLCKGAAHSRLILFALLVFDAALLADWLFPMFEPIYFGWFPEIAGGVLVLCIGITLANEIAGQIQLRQAVEARAACVAKMLAVHKTYYPALLEKEQETRAARHDLRHHINLFREMLGRGDTKSLMRYLDEYTHNQSMPLRISYCGHYVTDMLLGLYSGLAEDQGVELRIHAEVPEALPVSDVDLCVMLSNLLENALEASAKLIAEESEIVVRISEKCGQFIILIENAFDGILVRDHDKILSAKSQGREGVGIASVRSAVAKYDGETEFYVEGNRFYSGVYVPICRKEV